MSSLPDFDAPRPVPLRFGRGRVNLKPVVVAPAPRMSNGDLTDELEAALVRNLQSVDAAFPPATRAERPPSEDAPPPPAPPSRPSESIFAPRPKPNGGASADARRDASEPQPLQSPASLYAPRRVAKAPPIVDRREPEPRPATPVAAVAVAHPNRDSAELPDWLNHETPDEPTAPPVKPRSGVSRPVMAVAVLMAAVVLGGTFVALRPASQAARPSIASASILSAGIRGAEAIAAVPLPQAAKAPEPVAEEVAPPMTIAPITSASAGADVPIAAPEAPQAAGHVETGAPTPPTAPRLRSTAAPVAPAPVVVAKPPAAVMIGGDKASVTIDVNMRSGPDNAAPVVKVVKAGSPVSVLRCDYWCEVVASGQRGFIFKRFLARAG